jgi:hypothetical protein
MAKIPSMEIFPLDTTPLVFRVGLKTFLVLTLEMPGEGVDTTPLYF